MTECSRVLVMSVTIHQRPGIDRLKLAIHGLEDDDVHWVVTVPAIWNEQARQFMIEASAKAGIEKENLTLALEPECAAMYCRYLAMDKKEHGDNMEIKAFDENAKFMVVDLGGQKIIVGEVVTQYEVVLKAKSRWANLEMYTTKDDKPRTIIDNDHFTKIGSIIVKLPQFKRESILILTISYDETEFKVVATDKNTGRCFVGTCRFLEKESN
ncbi:unnamed protein product [Mytilus edulis]|uniref:Uncharacterized protein n=1 Tax=Mytilus edulis TaxID=6550 RepID=A0A8S3QDZ4_MYTED|nr:unnamed protein product [Mytilus edulis]